jgi:hypothetical protein
MTGEKFKPLVIGKSKNPRCFKKVKKLPVDYHANKRSWMTSSIFLDCLANLNKVMRKSNRKVLLFVENTPCYPHDLALMSNVDVKFLPPNTTSKLQPCDLGIIRMMKSNYRKQLLRSSITRMETASKTAEIVNTVNVLGAFTWHDHSWNMVSTDTIK